MQKRKWWIGLLLLLVLLAVDAGCFAAGKSTEIARSNAERELNIMLNRSDLEGLDEIEGPIYVTGHKSPDSDTVGSSIAYAKLL